MSRTLTAKQAGIASQYLGRLDKIAADIQDNYASWGMSFNAAKSVVQGLDKVADEFEANVFGADSLAKRQGLVVAKVVQRDSDESYMDTFNNPMKPVQTDADEPYMSAYNDDQSSAVELGKSTTGRPLAP